MPSEQAAMRTDSGLVRCRLVNDELPVGICDQEQGGPLCNGCTASSRRCTSCGKAHGIADAARGWCEKCVKSKGLGQVARTLSIEGEPDKALQSVFERVRAVGGDIASPLVRAALRSAPTDPGEIPRPPFMKNPDAMYPALMDHGFERGGTWTVSAPDSVLMSRFHLLRDEARTVLAALAKKGFLQGGPPWLEVVLLKTDGIEEVRAKLDNPRAVPKDEKLRWRKPPRPARPSAPSPTGAEPSLPTSTAVQNPPRLVAPPSAAELPSMRPIATYREIYAHLFSTSKEIKGERLSVGAIPVIQIRFKPMTAEQAKESLEWFLANGHAQQRDGWRTIALISQAVDSEDGPKRAQVPSRAGASVPGSGARPPAVRSAQGVSAPAPTGGSKATAVAQAPAELPSVEGLLGEIERMLPELRQQRDALSHQIAKLEGMSLGLGTANGDPKSLEAARQLLSSLLRK